MLVVTRKLGETVVAQVGDINITVRLLDIKPGRVRIGLEAPDEVKLLRGELLKVPETEQPVIPG